jgi:hypothetical protein
LYDLREAEQFWRDHKDSIFVITDDNDKELGDFPVVQKEEEAKSPKRKPSRPTRAA